MHCYKKKSRSESGIAAILAIAVFFSFLAFLGFAVDLATIHTAQYHMQSAMDTTVVAAVDQIEKGKTGLLLSLIRAAIEDNLRSNGIALTNLELRDEDIILGPPLADPPREVTVSACLTVPLRILSLVPYFQDYTKVCATAKAVSKRLLLILLLDNSDSMDNDWDPAGHPGEKKWPKVQEGVTDFFNIIDPGKNDYIGVITFGGLSATILQPLAKNINLDHLTNQINALGTVTGTATGLAFKKAHDEFERVLSSITLLPTDLLRVVIYSDGAPWVPFIYNGVLYGLPDDPPTCMGWMYGSPYPIPPSPPAPALLRLNQLAHVYLHAIYEADKLRSEIGPSGVSFYSLGIGQTGTITPGSNCASSMNYDPDDPFQCVNNAGSLLKHFFMARVANDVDVLASDRDGDSRNGIQPLPDFPSCVPANNSIPGPRGKSEVANDPTILNSALAAFGHSIHVEMIQ